MGDSWSDLRRRVARIGASLDVVVRSDPEVCGLSGLDLSPHPSSQWVRRLHGGMSHPDQLSKRTGGELNLHAGCVGQATPSSHEQTSSKAPTIPTAGLPPKTAFSVRGCVPATRRRALMLAAGLGIAVLLQQLPQQVDVLLLVSEAIDNLIGGIQQLLEAMLGLAAIVVIASLVVLASVLSFGGVWRLIRLVRMLLKRNPQGRR